MTRMQSFKKSVAFYMALIMVVGLITPFATRPVVVLAEPVPAGLLATFGQALRAVQGSPAPILQNITGPQPPGAAMFSWPVGIDPTTAGAGMYALRFFDHEGRRNELTVTYMDEGRLMVNFDVLIGVDSSGDRVAGPGIPFDPARSVAGYINVHDPFYLNLPATGAPTDLNSFQVFQPLTGSFYQINTYFNNFFTPTMMDPLPGEGTPYMGRRVNNRIRYGGSTATHPGGFTFTPTLNDPSGLGVYPLNINDHPDVFNRYGSPRVGSPAADAPAQLRHFRGLSPSFNINLGQGYSFRFLGVTYHFLWTEAGMFHFYIDDPNLPGQLPGLRPGLVYAFDLEFREGTLANASRYFTNDIATFLTDGYNPADVPAITMSNRMYIFPGFDEPPAAGVTPGLLANSVVAIPFAQNLDPYSPHADATGRVDNTLQWFLDREPAFEAGTSTPFFDTSHIRIPNYFRDGDPMASPPVPATPVTPASPPGGLDIRFNLPNVFNEQTGRFDLPLHDYMQAPGNEMPEDLQARLVALEEGPATTENFTVIIDLADLEIHSPARYHPRTATGQFNPSGPAELNTHAANNRMRLTDVSLLHRAGRVDPDRVRIKIDDLLPSTVYNPVTLYLSRPAGGGVTNFLSRSSTVATFEDPFYTFMDFDIVNVGGRMHLRVVPFGVNTGQIRAGSYQLRAPGEERATSFFEGGNNVVLLPLPGIFGAQEFQIVFSNQVLAPFPPMSVENRLFRSQNIVWTPDQDANVGIPEDFRIIKNDSNVAMNPSLRPQPGFEDDIQYDSVAELSFWAEWEIGPIRDIDHLLSQALPGPNGFPRLNIEYVLGRALAPDTVHREGHGWALDPTYRDFVRVTLEIENRGMQYMPGGVTGSALYVRMVGEYAVYIPFGDFRGPLAPFAGEWIPLPFRVSPITGENVYIARVPFLTDATHIYRADPTPPVNPRAGEPGEPSHFRPGGHLYAGFQFPNIYFINTRVSRWWRYVQRYDANGNPYTSLNHHPAVPGTELGLPASRFDYIVLDDLRPDLGPPPPTGLTVTANPSRTEAPELWVRYDLPLAALRTYLDGLYPHQDSAIQLTADLYISQFEDMLEGTFFSGAYPPALRGAGFVPTAGLSLAPEHRGRPDVTHSIPFANVRGAHVPGRGVEIDLSSVYTVLHGTGAGNVGVVRITGIPLMWNDRNFSDVLGRPLGGSVNFDPNNFTMAQQLYSFGNTRDILHYQGDTFPQFLNLQGLDENRQYFLFADLTVHKFATPAALAATVVSPRTPPSNTSIFTGIIADTTQGTVQVPDPGMVAPDAPSNLRVRDVEEMAATIYWDPIRPLPGEEGVRIEWEILRIPDGRRLDHDSELIGSRETRFPVFFAQLQQNIAGIKGWQTDGTTLTTLPGNVLHEDPNDGEYYYYDLNEVSLRDRTLLPNSLYFFYVRTVRIVTIWDYQLGGYVEVRSYSVWNETTVTTTPITPPVNLRLEDGYTLRPGVFDPYSQALVSWEHEAMVQILEGMGSHFLFQYVIREVEDEWGEIMTVPPNMLPNLATGAHRDPFNVNRVRYLVTNLSSGTTYQMQVRLLDVTSGDTSTWSNMITFTTYMTDEDRQLERDTDDWQNHLRRQLEELLRRPFWFAQNTPTSTIMIQRPAEIFAGEILSTPGTAISLYNTDANRIVYYLPVSVLTDANNARRGFSTRYSDLNILLAPHFINPDHNQAIMDMVRVMDARGSDISDYFVRVDLERTPMTEINGVPAATRQTHVSMSLVATNRNIRNIASWDLHVMDRAQRIVDDVVEDAIMRQNLRNLLLAGTSNEDMVDYVFHVVERASAEITRMVASYMRVHADGILTTTQMTVTEFDSPMHVMPNNTSDDMFVAGFTMQAGQWIPQVLVDTLDGPSIISRAPGTFAFTGRVVNIPGIVYVPQGQAITGIVARFGLEDILGLNLDLQQNANRHMVVGSVARIAGAPHGADPMTWAAANLNVTMTSRNGDALISRQEAIAVVMALYEQLTNTRVDSVMIRNFQNTADMNLDNRFAQAVRAAFEVGLVTDTQMNPEGPLTIGEFLDILAALNARLPL